MIDERLRRVRETLDRISAPPLATPLINKRAAVIERRRIAGNLLVAAVIGAAVFLPLALLRGLHDSPHTHAVVTSSSSSATIEAPSFPPRDGWFTASLSPSASSEDIPILWASIAPFSDPGLEGDPPAQTIGPDGFTYPESTLSDMTSGQIVITVALELPDVTPAPSGNPNFPDATLPLSLDAFEHQDAWEGQSGGAVSRYRGLFRVNEQYVTVDVYFGVATPGQDLMTEAQDELNTLSVPSG